MQLAFKDHALVKKHGGDLRVGRRKVARPIATKRNMHLTLRSSKARGRLSLLTKRKQVEEIIQKYAKLFEVRIQSQSNNGNHLHLLVQARTRGGFKRFLMAISGRIAQLMTRSTKGKPLDGRFWDFIPFTRIVEWGKDFVTTWRYVKLNQLEAAGLVPFRPRQTAKKRATTRSQSPLLQSVSG